MAHKIHEAVRVVDGMTLRGDYLVVKGSKNRVYGNHCIIEGNENRYEGDKGYIKGDWNKVNGNENAVEGTLNTIVGRKNIVKGKDNIYDKKINTTAESNANIDPFKRKAKDVDSVFEPSRKRKKPAPNENQAQPQRAAQPEPAPAPVRFVRNQGGAVNDVDFFVIVDNLL
jgi:hypothetical protein